MRQGEQVGLLYQVERGGQSASAHQHRKHYSFQDVLQLITLQPKAADGFDWQDAITKAVGGAVAIAENQNFRDGNHRTALENMFDTLNYQGLSIRFDFKNALVYCAEKSIPGLIPQGIRRSMGSGFTCSSRA